MLLGDFSFHMGAMTSENARRRKFAELVAHHIFRDEHRQKRFAIVHVKSVANEIRLNR